MKKFYFILFSLIISSPVFADDLIDENDNTKLTLTGFVTTTVFSDPGWYNNTDTVAVNFDYLYEDYALRGQLNSNRESGFSRLTLEKNFFIKEGIELTAKVGRFPRLVSFYNNLTDSPGTYETAMIPEGVYTKRIMDSQAFNAIDGINLMYVNNFRNSDDQLKAYLNYGKVPMERPCLVQQEYTYDKCVPGFIFESDSNDYDYGVSYEVNKFTFIASNTNVQFNLRLIDPNDPFSRYVASVTKKLIANVSKFGVKYNAKKFLIQGEVSYHQYSTIRPDDVKRDVQNIHSYYILGSYHIRDNLSVNAQYSYQMSNLVGDYNDRSVGIKYTVNNLVTALDYHVGSGQQWKYYLAEDTPWKSFVLSISYSF